jgi:hypothetical protein
LETHDAQTNAWQQARGNTSLASQAPYWQTDISAPSWDISAGAPSSSGVTLTPPEAVSETTPQSDA